MEFNSEMPVCTALENWKNKNRSRFFMPGHKGRGPMANFLSLEYDVTELAELDDLHNPMAVVAESERYISEISGSGHTLMLVNGAGSGLKAILLKYGKGKIVVPRNSHRAVLEGIILSGADPEYVMPETNGSFLLPAAVDNYCCYNRADLMVLLTETYEGFVRNYSSLKTKTPVVADEAHGGHLRYMGLPSAVDYAEYTVHGTHKTMGSMTQSGLLHFADRIAAENTRQFLQLVTTTSPSWLMIASLEKAVNWWSEFEEPEKLAQSSRVLKERIDQLPGMKAVFDSSGTIQIDPLRLTVLAKGPLDGFQLGDLLRENYGIEIELCRPDGVVAILTPFDPPGSWESLYNAFYEISRDYGFRNEAIPAVDFNRNLPRKYMLPAEAFFQQKEWIQLSQGTGRIAANIIAAYPPGIPVLVPGELIEAAEIEYIEYLQQKGSRFQGLKDGKLLAVKES